jgi:hypothetical protein
MTDMPANKVVTSLIKDIRRKPEEALSITKAAESCALDDNINHSVQILIDFKGLGHEAQDLFKAALTIQRSLLAETA